MVREGELYCEDDLWQNVCLLTALFYTWKKNNEKEIFIAVKKSFIDDVSKSYC